MNYVLTGSIGHITKPTAEKLLKAGNQVTIISSKAENKATIESIGAKAAIGSVEDLAFLEETFKGADAVYLMIPPKWTVTDWIGYQSAVADNYISAIKLAKIKYTVLLSSIGAHMRKGAGPVDGLGYLEEKISKEQGIHTLSLRPSYFYYNLFSMIPLIKNAGIMGSAQGADHKLVLTHTNDIADVAAEELLALSFKGYSIRYIASDERTWGEITDVLTSSIGKKGTPFVEFSDEQSLQGMLGAGLSDVIANGYVAMGKALRSGEMEADYWKNKPAKYGKVKLEDFAKEFAGAYNAS